MESCTHGPAYDPNCPVHGQQAALNRALHTVQHDDWVIQEKIRAAVVEEREECAKLIDSVCDEWDEGGRFPELPHILKNFREVAAAIRGRGER